MQADNVNDRLKQSSYGTPKIDPDQQRRYLGIFRERVSLGIKIKDVSNPHAAAALKRDVKNHPQDTILINNAIGEAVSTYIQIANQNHVNFDLKTGYTSNSEGYGVIYAAPKTAINQHPISWDQKYPLAKKTSSKKNQDSPTQKPSSLWQHIKDFFH